eukprot:7094128-Pyramimonas_sp.AAC.1
MQSEATINICNEHVQYASSYYVNRLKKYLRIRVRTWINMDKLQQDWMKWSVPHLMADMYVFPIYSQIASTH